MTTAELALLLASDDALARIAQREDAADFHAFVLHIRDSIDKAINRPETKRYCGNCPTPLDDHQRRQLLEDGEEDRETCATPLYTKKKDDIEVTCFRCKQTFNAEKLIQQALSRKSELLYSEQEVLEIMREIGRPIPERTWRYWRASGKLINRSEWSAEPAYWLEDVLALRAQSANRKAG